ncbi:MAG: methyltransferase domain-containing protein, partial [Pirellulaceae bacterium]
NSDYTPNNHLRAFMARASENSIVVELGSGARRLSASTLNLDLFAFPNVDAMADVKSTPLRDESVDYVVIDTVLEHCRRWIRLDPEDLR